MFTIGVFARLANVSIRTLRHYDEIGLLVPASVDPSTGYRSYRAGQLPRLHRIVALKDLGLGLDEIERLLDQDLGAAELQRMLIKKRSDLERRVDDDKLRLARVEQRLRYIEMETDMTIDLVVKQIGPTRVAQLRWDGDGGLSWPDIETFAQRSFGMLRDALGRAGVTARGALFLHYVEFDDGLAPMVAIPIGDQHLEPIEGVEVVDLPAIEALVTVHRGGAEHAVVGPIYGEMHRYAEDNRLRAVGPGRDHFLGIDGDAVVMELQLPVSRIGA